MAYATYDDLRTHLNHYFELIDFAFKIISYERKFNLLHSIIQLNSSLVKETNDYTEGFLHIAIEQKQYLLIRMMCTMFPDALNHSNFFDDTPLHSLAYWFQFEKTDKLIETYDLLSEYSSQTKNKLGMTPDFIRAIWDVEFRQIKHESIPEDLWFNSPNYYLDKEIESASFDLDQPNDTDEDC